MATKLGDAYVTVTPDFSGFQEKVAKRLNESIGPAMDRVGKSAGKRLGKSLGDGVADSGAQRSLRSSLQPLVKRLEAFGEDAHKAIDTGMRRRASRATQKSVSDALGLDDMSRFFADARKEAEKGISPFERIGRKIRTSFKGMGGDFRRFGDDLRTVTSRHLKAFGGDLKSSASGIRRFVGELRASAGGFGNFEGIMARANRGFQFFRNILGSLKLPTLAAGLALLAQSLSALAAGAVATASALGPLSGALIALPALALAGAQAVGTLKLALSGIGDAVKAAVAVQVRGGEQATQTLRQQESAAEAVADAHRTLASAERDAEYATEDLTKARKDATEQLHEMERASRESRLTEQEGSLALREARRELNKTLKEPSSTGFDIRSAEQAVERAKFGLEATREEAKKARKEYAEAQSKGGVSGMPEVVSARRAQADADRSVADAERGLAKAERDNTDAMAKQGSAATALQQKMAELTPSGRKFAKFLISLKPRYDELRETASKGFFPGAESGIKSALKNFGVFKGIVGETSDALGQLSAEAGDKLGSEAWGRDLAKIGESDTRVIEDLGQASLNLGDAFRNVLVPAQPLIEWMGRGTVKLSEWARESAQAGRETGSLGRFFGQTREAMEKVWRILRPLGEGFLNVGHFAKGLGNEILDSLGDAAEGWAKWTKTTSGKNTLRNYFKEVKPAIYEIGELVHDATIAFVELGRQKGVSTLVRALRTTLIPALRDGSGAITGMLSGFIQRFNKLRREGVPLFAAFLQDLAEHAAEAGKEIAKALVTAFLNSDIWGKLAIGGWLFAKFGGGKAFESMGAKFGKQFATAFLLAVLGTELAKQIKQIIEGEKLDAPKSEEFSKFLKGYFEVDQAFITKPNRVKIKTALGNILFNSETEKVVATSSKKLQWIVGKIPEQFIVKFEEMRRLQQVMHKYLGPLPGIAGKAGTDMKSSLLPKLKDLAGTGGSHLEALGGSFESLSGTVSESVETIQKNVSGILKSFGIGHVPKFTVKYLHAHAPSKGKKYLNKLPEFATGGLAATVPGNSTGDRHVLALGGRPVAKVESGEGIFVGNRKMMAAAKAANDAVPRFQTGGVAKRATGGLVEPKLEGNAGPLKQLGQAAIKKVYEGAKSMLGKQRSLGGGAGGPLGSMPVGGSVADHPELQPGISAIVATILKKWSGLQITSTTGGGHAENSYHYLGRAADLGASSRSYEFKAAEWIKEKLGGNLTEGIHNPNLSIDGGNEVSPAFWGPETWGEHLTHIHVAKQRGGLLGFLKGFTDGGFVDASGEQKAVALRIGRTLLNQGLNFRGAAGIIGNAWRESLWNPASVGTGGGGLWGFTTPPISLADLQATASAKGVPWTDVDYQTHFMWSGPSPAAPLRSALNGQPNAADAAEYFDSEWERSGIKAMSDRKNGAREAMRILADANPAGAREAASEVGAAGAEKTAKPKEKPLGHYAGVSTGPISFGHPKTLDGTNRELDRLTGKDGKSGLLKAYRHAANKARADKKLATADLLDKRVHSIEQRVAGLRKQRRNLRMVEAGKALKKRITGKLSKIEGYDQRVQGAQHLYEQAGEIAEGIVGLEPESPEVGPEPEVPEQAKGESDKAYEKKRRDIHNAYETSREGTEKDYAARFTDYVEGKERPAYQNVLARIADWRNSILGAETHGFGDGSPSIDNIERGLEHSARYKINKIGAINDFTKVVGERVQAYWAKVKDDVSDWRSHHKGKALPDWLKKEQEGVPHWLKKQEGERDREREKLPFLRTEKTELEEAIGTAREAFFAGGKNRLVDPPTLPRLPLPGSGTFEGYLEEVQGIHQYPQLHELLDVGALAPPRDPSRFRGAISSAQESIEGLGLKTRQAGSSVQKASIEGEGTGGSGSEDQGDSERTQLLEELLKQANQRLAVNTGLGSVLNQFEQTYPVTGLPFAGTFHSGGTVNVPGGGDAWAHVRDEEHILTPEQMAALTPASEATASGAPVIESLVIHPDGTATMRYEGREFETAVREVVRTTQRGASVGGAGRAWRP